MDPLREFESAVVPILWLSNAIKMMTSAPFRKWAAIAVAMIHRLKLWDKVTSRCHIHIRRLCCRHSSPPRLPPTSHEGDHEPTKEKDEKQADQGLPPEQAALLFAELVVADGPGADFDLRKLLLIILTWLVLSWRPPLPSQSFCCRWEQTSPLSDLSPCRWWNTPNRLAELAIHFSHLVLSGCQIPGPFLALFPHRRTSKAYCIELCNHSQYHFPETTVRKTCLRV